MNISCNIIEDLLPLYVEGLCSPESEELIREHLRDCQNCRATLDILNSQKIPFEKEDIESLEEKRVLKKGFRKITKRSLIRFSAVLLVICLLGLNAMLIVNQVTGDGRCYESLDKIHTVKSFFQAIKNGNYEKAANFIDYKVDYKDLTEALMTSEGVLGNDYAKQYYQELPAMTEESYCQYMKERMIKSLKEFAENGNKITKIKYYGAYRIENRNYKNWEVEISVNTEGPNASNAIYTYFVKDGKITYGGGMFSDDDMDSSDTLEDALKIFFTDELEGMYR